jgi:DNA repair protein SbcD/Mre11
MFGKFAAARSLDCDAPREFVHREVPMSQPFRFLQTGDFHLEQPLHGVAEIPDDWRHLLVDAPLQAARKVFETAVKEEVDFVLLTGDSLDPPQAGPRAISFLLDQFQLLHERGIAVYWVGGAVDRAEEWPAGLRFPESVHLYPNNRVIEITHMKGDVPIASIYGQSRSTRSEIRLSDFDHDDAEMFSIAVCHGFLEAASLQRLRMDYWALGGEHERRSLGGLAATAHYAGSPQGRSPDEVGPHGCTLIQVDEERRIRSRFIPTDAVRWQREKIVYSPTASLLELERLLFDRARKLIAEGEDRPQLATFVVDGIDRWTVSARKPGTPARIVEKLREEFARTKPALHTVELEFTSSTEPDIAWFEEDSIRGDYLRGVREWEQDSAATMEVEGYLPDPKILELLELDVKLEDRAVRTAVLKEAAVLGVELLSADDPGPLDRAAIAAAHERRKEARS